MRLRFGDRDRIALRIALGDEMPDLELVVEAPRRTEGRRRVVGALELAARPADRLRDSRRSTTRVRDSRSVPTCSWAGADCRDGTGVPRSSRGGCSCRSRCSRRSGRAVPSRRRACATRLDRSALHRALPVRRPRDSEARSVRRAAGSRAHELVHVLGGEQPALAPRRDLIADRNADAIPRLARTAKAAERQVLDRKVGRRVVGGVDPACKRRVVRVVERGEGTADSSIRASITPRRSWSRSSDSNSALKLPSPKPSSPLRWMNSKNTGPSSVPREDLQQQALLAAFGGAVEQDAARLQLVHLLAVPRQALVQHFVVRRRRRSHQRHAGAAQAVDAWLSGRR